MENEHDTCMLPESLQSKSKEIIFLQNKLDNSDLKMQEQNKLTSSFQSNNYVLAERLLEEINGRMSMSVRNQEQRELKKHVTDNNEIEHKCSTLRVEATKKDMLITRLNDYLSQITHPNAMSFRRKDRAVNKITNSLRKEKKILDASK